MVESGAISEAYRIVNGQDVVACTPRTVNTLVLGNIGYDHCGHTVLITQYADRQSLIPSTMWLRSSGKMDTTTQNGMPSATLQDFYDGN